MTDAPFFRFYPGAYDAKHGQFERSDEDCDICGQTAIWLYKGVIYTSGTSPSVCARCLHAGRIGAFLKQRDDAETRALRAKHPDWSIDSYSLQDIELEEEVSDEAHDELMLRTPSVASYNPFDWPVHDGLPMAWIGAGNDEGLIANTQIWQAMQAAWTAIWPDETLDGPTDYLLIFQSVEGHVYRAVVDLD